MFWTDFKPTKKNHFTGEGQLEGNRALITPTPRDIGTNT